MKNIPGSDGVNAEDITDWTTKDKVNELTGNDIVEMVNAGRCNKIKIITRMAIKISSHFERIEDDWDSTTIH